MEFSSWPWQLLSTTPPRLSGSDHYCSISSSPRSSELAFWVSLLQLCLSLSACLTSCGWNWICRLLSLGRLFRVWVKWKYFASVWIAAVSKPKPSEAALPAALCLPGPTWSCSVFYTGLWKTRPGTVWPVLTLLPSQVSLTPLMTLEHLTSWVLHPTSLFLCKSFLSGLC